MNLVPLKTKIGLNQKGQARYPQFGNLKVVQDSNMDWSQYVDTFGAGWYYDKQYGHKEEGPDSPVGTQWGVLLVPKVFADEAVVLFPDECSTIDEVTFTTFYEERVTAHLSDMEVDEQALKPYILKEQAGIALSAKEQADRDKALDPNDSTRGINKNLRKKWADFKTKMGITIIQ